MEKHHYIGSLGRRGNPPPRIPEKEEEGAKGARRNKQMEKVLPKI